jgi:hypothetical protein
VLRLSVKEDPKKISIGHNNVDLYKNPTTCFFSEFDDRPCRPKDIEFFEGGRGHVKFAQQTNNATLVKLVALYREKMKEKSFSL